MCMKIHPEESHRRLKQLSSKKEACEARLAMEERLIEWEDEYAPLVRQLRAARERREAKHHRNGAA